MITITASAGGYVLRPLLVLGYTWTLNARNNIHPLVGSASPAVTVRPATLRSGTLRLLFANEQQAAAAELVHSLGSALTLADSDRLSAGMTYHPTGRIEIALDPETRSRWIVSVDFQAVAP
ncbi:hypothetical protein [Herbiconiux flava]|uniref:Uncharacterized protein n=1 Tax=Herbiconiux flava TaxID=881268 RepID=A0A852SU69_9MICO|nr:hypothetical protein [Herbiconiux flava]NYD72292.1 hypothetical protein [Herbiconiux flava]GLK17745.1 hypothetical protein GCM10017602_22270 [Herbiconiux flava]